RALRAGRFGDSGYRFAAKAMEDFHASSGEIAPGEEVRRQASRLLRVHDLRAADSLQLAAALVWCSDRPEGQAFVSLDRRLRDAAELEGFTVLPADAPALG
ncbi:MAG TPA: PIN domain-containing protein, partial [Thermoanaerobaculia bacterium]|nr:PIN domain-containing protein [Thermoanaerobaculia bacterium]